MIITVLNDFISQCGKDGFDKTVSMTINGQRSEDG